ncbi:MAG: AraC family transcriptional regulator [Verrucomicrobiaceae bacterium]|nr:AraC family transcriptional regulator [Verrucomicrobiaceae bacterium]
MLRELWKTEARLDAAAIWAEVGTYEWPQPLETRDCLDTHQFVLSLSPRPGHSRVRYDCSARDDTFINTGDVIFFPSATPFCGKSDGGHQRMLVCSLEASLGELRAGNESWSEGELIAGLDLKDAKLRATLARVAQEAINPGFASAMLIEALLTTAVVDLMRYFERRSAHDDSSKGGLAPWQLRRVRDRVEHSDVPAPSVEDLARLCGISARHLMRGFKKSNGTTLHSYVEQVRLDKAKDFLLKTNLPLKTISWKLGFAHASSFSSAFQRALGVSPTLFRAQSRYRVGDSE